ncbi:MAG: DUF3473 domain-containing protein [Alphaproteobacteria bacterium]|nr:DUF3473 domain-containing protein [Alphaproteobacteria bacterium]
MAAGGVVGRKVSEGAPGVAPASGAGGDASSAAAGGGQVNALTVDVEEYFQVSAFAGRIDRDDWGGFDARVEQSTEQLLALFDEFGARCTFFTLGWIAERHPALIRRLVDAGHELASHGFAHVRVTDQNPDSFRADIRRTKALLEDTGGVPVNGFRAASFSLDQRTPWAHEILGEEGYRYSSSIYPVSHDHYGMPDSPRFPWYPADGNGVVEIPLSTVRLLGRNLPCAGGGYFRLLPYLYYRWAIGRLNRIEGRSSIFYFHPWEIDPGQPRQGGISAKTRFRHYVNLDRMESKLRCMLADFAWDRIDRVFPAATRETS